MQRITAWRVHCRTPLIYFPTIWLQIPELHLKQEHLMSRRFPEPCRVLIVDDHADTVSAYQMLCNAWGYEARHAFDAESALKVLAKFRPDLAVVDLGLPGMSGYELARLLRADAASCGITLLAITGYGRQSDRRKALEAGFDDFFLKPVDIDILETRFEEHCGAFPRTKTDTITDIHR